MFKGKDSESAWQIATYHEDGARILLSGHQVFVDVRDRQAQLLQVYGAGSRAASPVSRGESAVCRQSASEPTARLVQALQLSHGGSHLRGARRWLRPASCAGRGGWRPAARGCQGAGQAGARPHACMAPGPTPPQVGAGPGAPHPASGIHRTRAAPAVSFSFSFSPAPRPSPSLRLQWGRGGVGSGCQARTAQLWLSGSLVAISLCPSTQPRAPGLRGSILLLSRLAVCACLAVSVFPGLSVLVPRSASRVTLAVRADARDLIYLSIYHSALLCSALLCSSTQGYVARAGPSACRSRRICGSAAGVGEEGYPWRRSGNT